MHKTTGVLAAVIALAALTILVAQAQAEEEVYKVHLPIVFAPTRPASLDSTLAFHERCDDFLRFPDFPLPPHPCQVFKAVSLGGDMVVADDDNIYQIFYSVPKCPPQYDFEAGEELTLVLHVWAMYSSRSVEAGRLRVSTLEGYPN